MNELMVLNVEELNMKSSFAQAKKTLTEILEDDKSIVVTSQTLDACKKRITFLNGLSKRINDQKIRIKKEASVDIVKFENGCKELIAEVDIVSTKIKEGTVQFEVKRRQEKKDKCELMMREAIEGQALNDKYSAQISVVDSWLNISTTLTKIKAEIDDKCSFLKQAQDREEQNREAIVLAILQANIMLELSSPLAEKDFVSILSDTENANIPQAMTEINRVARSRKDAEVAAVARAKAIEAIGTAQEQFERELVEEKQIESPVIATIPQTSPPTNETVETRSSRVLVRFDIDKEDYYNLLDSLSEIGFKFELVEV